MPAFVSNEVPPLSIGLARRAIDDITELAAHTARFPAGPRSASGRSSITSSAGPRSGSERPGRCTGRRWRPPTRGRGRPGAAEEQQLAVTTASVFAVETCADVVGELFKFGGGRALALSNPMQRHLRNVLAARQHVALSEENYEAAGRYLLESAKARALPDGRPALSLIKISELIKISGEPARLHRAEAARRAETEDASVDRAASVISMSRQASVTDWP